MTVRLTALILLLVLGANRPAVADDPLWLRQYNRALRGLWSEVYRDGGETLYCGVRFGREKGKQINAEHVFPMSWVARELGCGTRGHCRITSPAFNRIEDDLHNIFPALAEINEARGARRYGEIPRETRAYGNCDVEIEGRQIEPRPQVRGDIARAMFYMRERYGLPLYPRHAKLLARWNLEDPPDAAERARNDRIQRIQGQRNPYIDHPGLVGTP
jgi:deoxyribonuclease-1